MQTKITTGRIQRKKQRTTKKIVDTALELMLKQGFEHTTMEQIAEESDIAKGTLYKYFPAKEAILGEHIKNRMRERSADLPKKLYALGNTKERLLDCFTNLIEGIETQKELFEKYLVYRMQQMVSFDGKQTEESGFRLLSAEIIRLGQESDEIRTDLDTQILTELFEFTFIEIVKQYYKYPHRFASDRIIEKCTDLFLDGAGIQKN